jgi:glycosyltransferase involved in cell wall biosynthesis
MAQATILMAVKDGARFLPEQLASIAAQEDVSWSLVAADDGSADDSPEILADFARAHPGRVRIVPGPRSGIARNFLGLLAQAPNADLTAFSDQDDAWLPGKLARAAEALSRVPDERAALYASRTIVCDAGLRPLGLSPLFRRTPSFRNALVQSIAGGNTMVLNRAGLRLAQSALPRAGGVAMHDWWLYQVVAGAGGEVIYDPEPALLYRQHGGNAIGANASWPARFRRAALVAKGRFRAWNEANIAALREAAPLFTPENRALLEGFAAARRAPLAPRLAALRRLGLYRQTRGGDASLWFAAAAGLV